MKLTTENIIRTIALYSTLEEFLDNEVNVPPSRGKEDERKEINTSLKWVAFKQQFFSSVLIADNAFLNAEIKSTKFDDNNKYLRKFNSLIGLPYDRKPDFTIPLSLYFGPNHYNTLKKFELELEELVTLGNWIIKWINRFVIIPVFNFLDNFISYS